MSDLTYKLAVARECAAVMEQKLIEKEPRPSWREIDIDIGTIRLWLFDEVVELINAPRGEEMREAADVANLAAIYADMKRKDGAQ
jgi:hypothetical protein